MVKPTGYWRWMGYKKLEAVKTQTERKPTRRDLRDHPRLLFYKWGSRGTEPVSILLQTHNSLL